MVCIYGNVCVYMEEQRRDKAHNQLEVLVEMGRWWHRHLKGIELGNVDFNRAFHLNQEEYKRDGRRLTSYLLTYVAGWPVGYFLGLSDMAYCVDGPS